MKQKKGDINRELAHKEKDKKSRGTGGIRTFQLEGKKREKKPRETRKVRK